MMESKSNTPKIVPLNLEKHKIAAKAYIIVHTLFFVLTGYFLFFAYNDELPVAINIPLIISILECVILIVTFYYFADFLKHINNKTIVLFVYAILLLFFVELVLSVALFSIEHFYFKALYNTTLYFTIAILKSYCYIIRALVDIAFCIFILITSKQYMMHILKPVGIAYLIYTVTSFMSYIVYTKFSPYFLDYIIANEGETVKIGIMVLQRMDYIVNIIPFIASLNAFYFIIRMYNRYGQMADASKGSEALS